MKESKSLAKKDKIVEQRKKVNSKLLVLVTFFTSVLLIFSTYAWLSSSLNVKVNFFNMSVASDSGLFISLDAVEFSDSITISMDSIINDLYDRYPNHTNQWAMGGFWPVSTNGIKTPNNSKFDVYTGDLFRARYRYSNGFVKRLLNTKYSPEENPNALNVYLTFDIFLKNVTGSPKPDNLYIEDSTFIDYEEGTPDEVKEAMDGILNSMRFGLVRIGDTTLQSDVKTIQNLSCNNQCQMVIYEPNSTTHSVNSIEAARKYGVNLINGRYFPTYGIIGTGDYLEMTNGHQGTGIPLDTEHFALQNTITGFNDPIFQVPNGYTKLRAYLWIEGQDLDSLETNSKGVGLEININLAKDTAGYE